jgi:hypothetical protein
MFVSACMRRCSSRAMELQVSYHKYNWFFSLKLGLRLQLPIFARQSSCSGIQLNQKEGIRIYCGLSAVQGADEEHCGCPRTGSAWAGGEGDWTLLVQRCLSIDMDRQPWPLQTGIWWFCFGLFYRTGAWWLGYSLALFFYLVCLWIRLQFIEDEADAHSEEVEDGKSSEVCYKLD